jgi:hypothetical protein
VRVVVIEGSGVSRRTIRSLFVAACLGLGGLVTVPAIASAQGGFPDTQLTGVGCLDASACLAVGTYTSTSGLEQPLIEKWNHLSGWKLMRLPAMPTGASRVTLTSISCSGRDFCMAVGTYVASPTDQYYQTVPYGLVWHGSRWTLTSLPQPGGALGAQMVGISCSAPASCLAVGSYLVTPTTGGGLVEAWNGTTWSDVEALSMDSVACVVQSGCTAVGRIEAAGNEAVVAEHWSGTSWSSVATLASGDVVDDDYAPVQISCTASQCMAVTQVQDDLGDTFSAAWNSRGSVWSGVATPALGGGYGSGDRYFFDGVSCVGATSCTAVGGNAPYGESNLAERWNGSSWHVQPAPNLQGVYDTFLDGVSCPTTWSCLAIGEYNDPTRNNAIESFAERWTNAGWVITTPIAEPSV